MLLLCFLIDLSYLHVFYPIYICYFQLTHIPAYASLKSGKGEDPKGQPHKRTKKEPYEGGMMMKKTFAKLFTLILSLVALGVSAGAHTAWR